jgi:hypothetical protein
MQLVFVHVPKTAGFALHATLEEVFGALNTLQINDDDKLRFLRNSPPERFARYNYISGHFDFTDIATKCRPDAVFISILRDPIARILSEYNYMFSSAGHPYHEGVRRQSLSDYIFGNENHFRGFMCRQLTGFVEASMAVEVIRARYALVGLKSNLAAFLKRLGALIDKPLCTGEINVTPGQGRIDLDTSLCETLLNLTTEDRRLFDAVAGMPDNLFQGNAGRIAPVEPIAVRSRDRHRPIAEGVYQIG